MQIKQSKGEGAGEVKSEMTEWHKQAKNAIEQGQSLSDFIAHCHPDNRRKGRKAYVNWAVLMNDNGPQAGCQLIEIERIRQINQEGYSRGHDKKHERGELIEAAIAYAKLAFSIACYDAGYVFDNNCPSEWPWDAKWWKPCDQIRALTKAGALIAAEIDRLQMP